MLVQGPCGPPRLSFLLFLMPELDSPGRKTGHTFPVIHISKVNGKKTVSSVIIATVIAVGHQSNLHIVVITNS